MILTGQKPRSPPAARDDTDRRSSQSSATDESSSHYGYGPEKQQRSVSASGPPPGPGVPPTPPGYASSSALAGASSSNAPPSYHEAARPHPKSLGLFPAWAQHEDTQTIKLASRAAFSSKVFATDAATDVTILQWKSLSHRYTSVFRASTFLVENARTNEPLLQVQQDKVAQTGPDGNWTIFNARGEVLCTLSGSSQYGSGLDHRMQVSFINSAGGGERLCLSLLYNNRGRWDLLRPDGMVCAEVVQEGTFRHQASVTIPPYVDTLFLVALAMVTREEDLVRQRSGGLITGPIEVGLITAGVPQGMGIVGNVADGARGAIFGTNRRAVRSRKDRRLVGGLSGSGFRIGPGGEDPRGAFAGPIRRLGA